MTITTTGIPSLPRGDEWVLEGGGEDIFLERGKKKRTVNENA